MILWPRSCYLVGYYGWARTNMESAGAFKSWRVLVCGAAGTCSDHDSTIKYSMYRPGLATSEHKP